MLPRLFDATRHLRRFTLYLLASLFTPCRLRAMAWPLFTPFDTPIATFTFQMPAFYAVVCLRVWRCRRHCRLIDTPFVADCLIVCRLFTSRQFIVCFALITIVAVYDGLRREPKS